MINRIVTAIFLAASAVLASPVGAVAGDHSWGA